MMTMKKNIVMPLLALALGAAGCSGNNKEVKQESAASQAGQQPSAEQEAQYQQEAAQQAGGQEAQQMGQQVGTPLGETQVNAGESTIQTQKQVTRTITSQSELPTIRSSTVKGDLNRMSPSNLESLGLSHEQASNVVQYRDDQGGFKSTEELKNVPGMTDNMFNKLKEKVAVKTQRNAQ